MVEQPVRPLAPFARATREALESVAAPPIATSLLYRALAAAQSGAVPEDPGAFRAFVDGPLRAELTRALGAGAVTIVVGRLSALAGEASVSVSSHPPDARNAHQSGSHPVIRGAERAAARRPTVPAMPAAHDSDRGWSAAEGGRSASADHSGSDRVRVPRSPVPMAREEALGAREPRRPRPATKTLQALPPVRPLPTALLVVSTDAGLGPHLARELGPRCPVRAIDSPAELARATALGGARVVVLLDTALPAIDVATFAGLAPIFPTGTRVVLWGADERTHQRLCAQFPVARAWTPSGDARNAAAFIRAL